MRTTPLIRIIFSYLALVAWVGPLQAGKKPEEQSGYEENKDVGLKAPKGAEILFDGTMESVRKNWEMWPKKEMDITWSIMDNPNGKGKTLMTSGGKSWGSHDLVTKKKYSSYEGHVEFIMMGARGDGKPDGYTNSGVYMQNRYEIQIESPKGKTLQIHTTGKSADMELPLFAWIGFPIATHGVPTGNGMLFILFSRTPSGMVAKKSR